MDDSSWYRVYLMNRPPSITVFHETSNPEISLHRPLGSPGAQPYCTMRNVAASASAPIEHDALQRPPLERVHDDDRG
jgi:hypothetical protein